MTSTEHAAQLRNDSFIGRPTVGDLNRAADHIEQQAARIAELEEERDAVVRWLRGLVTRIDRDGGQRQADETLEQSALRANETVAHMNAERDAVRKALVWMYRRRNIAFVGDTLEHCLAVSDGTGASIEAALLAAHREGEGR